MTSVQFDQEPNVVSSDPMEELLEPGVMQQFTRAHRDGLDCLVGCYRLDFAPDQLRYPISIPIHPPLPATPSVEAETTDVSARIRVTNAEKFGVRLEVVLREPLEQEQSVILQISVSSPLE